jgi:site-specific DNA recombinase
VRQKERSGHYYYYHCKAPCRVRIKADEANATIESELQKFVPKPGLAELYREVICDEYDNSKVFYQTERKSLINLVTEQNNRITKLRELLLSEAIDVNDYKLMKSECEEKISRVEAKLMDLTQQMDSDIDIEKIVNEAVENLEMLLYLYKNANVKDKQLIIGSIFPKNGFFLIRKVEPEILTKLLHYSTTLTAL